MLQPSIPPVEPQPSLNAAARFNVGDRLLRALYPPRSNVAQLRWLGFAMLALAAIFPWLGGPFYTRLAIESFLFGATALSVDILLGYAGLLSLGQAAYFVLAGAGRGRRGRRCLFARSRGRRNPRQRRVFRSDHFRRRGDFVQDRAQH